MSAEMNSSASPRRARMNENPEGPPVPVTRIRGARPLPAGMKARRAAVLHGSVVLHSGTGNDVALSDDLERLGVERRCEPAPVAGRRVEKIGGEVVADARLRLEGCDRLELALEHVIDRDESTRPEFGGGGGRLVGVDTGHPSGGDQAGVVRGAVILVNVAGAVRIDGRGPHCLD